jgi:hypothetical protein
MDVNACEEILFTSNSYENVGQSFQMLTKYNFHSQCLFHIECYASYPVVIRPLVYLEFNF